MRKKARLNLQLLWWSLQHLIYHKSKYFAVSALNKSWIINPNTSLVNSLILHAKSVMTHLRGITLDLILMDAVIVLFVCLASHSHHLLLLSLFFRMTGRNIMSTWWANMGLQADMGDMKDVWVGIATTMGVTAASGWSCLVIYMVFQTLILGTTGNIWNHQNWQHWDFTDSNGYLTLLITMKESWGYFGYFARLFSENYGFIMATMPDYLFEIMDFSWLHRQIISLDR